MSDNPLIIKTISFVKEKLGGDKSGHDWWHVQRVYNLARTIAAKEKNADLLIVELAALLHDIADWKFNDGDFTAGPRVAREWLESQDAPEELISKVAYIVEHISYRGGTNQHVMQTLEGQIVQDADRLDALGAIGIARTFTFGGARQRDMYDPDSGPRQHKDFESYHKTLGSGTTINHFYEKLLLLKDKMHTKTARDLAGHRHKILEDFLRSFMPNGRGSASQEGCDLLHCAGVA